MKFSSLIKPFTKYALLIGLGLNFGLQAQMQSLQTSNPFAGAKASLGDANIKYQGTSDFKHCMTYLNEDWAQEVKNPDNPARWEGYWKETFEKYAKKVDDAVEEEFKPEFQNLVVQQQLVVVKVGRDYVIPASQTVFFTSGATGATAGQAQAQAPTELTEAQVREQHYNEMKRQFMFQCFDSNSNTMVETSGLDLLQSGADANSCTDENGTPNGGYAGIVADKENILKRAYMLTNPADDMAQVNQNDTVGAVNQKDREALEQLQAQALAVEYSEWKNFKRKYGQALADAFQAGETVRSELMKCEAYLGLTNSMDYSNSEYTRTQDASQSADGRLKCTTLGAITQDYPSCKSMLTAYNAAIIGKTGLDAYQQVDYLDHTIDAQTNFDGNDPTAGLKVQRDNVEKQADFATQQGSFDAAKLGVMLGVMNSMPTIESLVNQCISGGYSFKGITGSHRKYEQALKVHADQFKKFVKIDGAKNEGETIAEGITELKPDVIESYALSDESKIGDNKTLSEMYCNNVANSNQGLINNGPARDAAKQIAMQAGVDAATNFAKAAILNDQAGKIDDAIDGVKKFEPPDLSIVGQDALTEQCLADPTAPECSTFDFSQTRGFADGTGAINIGTGNATSVGSLNENDPTGSNSSANTDLSDRSDVVSPFGSPISRTPSDNSFASNGARAGIKTNKDGNGGGGGGGGPSGASAPNNPGPAPQGGAAPLSGARSVKVAYGGGKGSFGLTGGSGLKGTNKRNVIGNPFDKLLGKKDKQGKDDILNFRRRLASGEIGGKGTGLFQMISNRYKNVNKPERLIQYRAVQKN